jgi:NADPH2:quinone reductase
LVKVEAAPLNPSDLYFMEGKYDALAKICYPISPGWEGAGTVVESGGGFLGWMVNGKRVAFTKADEGKEGETNGFKLGGAYSEYVVTNAWQCVKIPDETSFEEGCSFFVNPITAIALIETAKDHGAQAVVITAACSQLGRMMIRLCQTKNYPVVCIVR